MNSFNSVNLWLKLTSGFFVFLLTLGSCVANERYRQAGHPATTAAMRSFPSAPLLYSADARAEETTSAPG